MDLTQAVAALKIKFDFKVGYPTTTPNRVSIIDDSSSISLSGTETVKYLFKITSPSGTVIYKNPGYDANDYTVDNKGTSSTYNIPLTASGAIEQGVYKAEVKVRYTNSVGSISESTTKTITTKELCICDKPSVSVSHSYDRTIATFTSTDDTAYSSSNLIFDSVTKEHTIIPPVLSGQSQLNGTSTILIYNQLWSGVWQSSVKSYAVFKGLNTADNSATNPSYSYFTFYCVGGQTTAVSGEDVICKMNCAIKVLEKKWKEEKGSTKDALFDKFTAGTNIITIAMNAAKCNDADNLAYLYDRFFEVTGIDKNCDCCSNDDEVGQILPTSSNGNGATSVITFTPSVIEEVAYQRQTGLFTTQDSPNVYAHKIKNQVWKTILDFATTPSASNPDHLLNDSPQVFVPKYEAALPISDNTIKIRYTHDGMLAIKGSFTYTYAATSVPSFDGRVLFYMPFLPTNGTAPSFNAIVKHTVAELANIKDYRSDMFIASDPNVNGGIPFLTFNYLRTNSGGDSFTVRIDDVVDLKNIFI